MADREEEHPATEPVQYATWDDGQLKSVEGRIPSERAITVYVNGSPLVGLRCSPSLLEELALGFLFNERVIETARDVAEVAIGADGACINVQLERDVELPAVRFVTSGPSGGATFADLAGIRGVDSDLRIPGSLVPFLAVEQLSERTPLHRLTGGFHGAMLADSERVVCSAEDVGRHNALDKVAGICLRQGWQMRDRIVATTGRISSDVLAKVARMQVPVVISRSSPTSLSVQLAREWGITLIGYARGRAFRVYAGQERLQL
jgi:FdhD protein